MNLSTIDIRLLLVFEALMRERSVSRAAQDVGMSQPAVSRALNTLRQMLKDELFVRSPGGISHNPAEDVREEDVEAAPATVVNFLMHLHPHA